MIFYIVIIFVKWMSEKEGLYFIFDVCLYRDFIFKKIRFNRGFLFWVRCKKFKV